MITKHRTGTSTAGRVGILRRLEKCHLPSLGPHSHLSSLLLGSHPETKMTLRKERIIDEEVCTGGSRGPSGDLGEPGQGDKGIRSSLC